ncbi:MAG: hypothetical protein FJX80_04035 [Bacteroidetes bacterium]|nr:hypothetical protein [Bacteroidota bacterium]
MAGGKETVRQKMIGMMYLVLTALLALNVSKQILDAFVEIERNIQQATLTQFQKANDDRAIIDNEIDQAKREMEAGKEGAKEKYEKLLQFREIMDAIDADAAKLIKIIDDAKLLILEKTGEDVTNVDDGNKNVIVWVPYSEKDKLQPAKLNLAAVESKDNFDVPIMELIGSEISAIDESKPGMAIWKGLLAYRKSIIKRVGTYNDGKNVWQIKNVDDINQFGKVKDLKEKIVSMLKSGGNQTNPRDLDRLSEIYEVLTKLEKADHNETKDIHWLGRTFDHAPLVGALASLSSLQNDVHTARARAFALLKTKLEGGAYSFNKVTGMAFPSAAVVDPNGEFNVTVFVGAYDTDKKPQVQSISGGGTLVESKEGMAVYKFRAPSQGEVQVSGRVGVPDTYGKVSEWLDFNTQVAVNSSGGSGSIGLPDVAVLYADWDNKITGALSGASVSDMSVTVNGQPCRKSGKFFIARVKASKETQNATIKVVGRDASGKTVAEATQQVKVRPFPDPDLLTGSMSRQGGSLFVGLKGSVLQNVTYTVEKIKINGQTYQGNTVPPAALRSAAPQSDVAVQIWWRRNGTSQTGFFKRAFTVN